MEEKLISIFDNLNIHFEQKELDTLDVNEAKLLKARVSKEKKKVYLTIEINQFLPVSIIGKIDEQIKKQEVTTKINFQIRNAEFDLTQIWAYIDFIKAKKAQQKGGAWTLIHESQTSFDQQSNLLKLTVNSNSEKIELTQEMKYLIAKLKQYGFANIKAEILIDQEANNLIDQQEEKYKKMALESQKQNISTNNKNDLRQNNYRREYGAIKWDEPSYNSLLDLEDNAQNIIIHGCILNLTIRNSKTGRKIYSLVVTDFDSSIKVVYFGKNEGTCLLDPLNEDELNADNAKEMEKDRLHVGDWIALKGRTGWSQFDNETVFTADSFKKIDKHRQVREDKAQEKRVELHTHTRMSVMDGITDAADYIKRADHWNWKALAITDHTNVQAFPDAFRELKAVNKKRKSENKEPLKLIYGSELTMLSDNLWYVKNPKGVKLSQAKYVVFDLETTGLSPEFDEIIEFGASIYDYQTGNRTKIDLLIKPKNPLKVFTKELTHITDEMLEDKPMIEEAFKQIYEIIQDGILVAHNANFDFNFLQSYAKKLGYPPLENTVLDTLTIARSFYPELKNHRLGTVAKRTGILYDDKIAHRGDYDADVLTDIFEHLWSDVKKNIDLVYDYDWEKIHPENNLRNMNFVRNRGYHVTVLVKNQVGLKELYKIISQTHTNSLLGSPKIFQNKLKEWRDNQNLLIGTSCVNGEIFDLARTNTLDVLEEKIKFYDYVEVQPLSVYKNLLQNDTLTQSELERTIRIIIEAGKKANKLIVATSDAHYLDPELKVIREVYINSKGLGGVNHPLYDFKHRVKNFPDQHLRTTQEMLNEFQWLGDDQLVQEIVITNPLKISDLVDEDIQAVKSGTYDPKIENVNELLTQKCYEIAHKMYGEKLPEIVEKRLELELNSIIKHGFAVVYWISHKLVTQSLEDGYLVGSRGSVGSSFVARTSEITEVNPLKPHYRCLKCQYSDFDTPPEIKCGYDLPIKTCPQCQSELMGDGHDIPFETFLGFDGDKVPDIDLNFSGEYQPIAHNFTKKMFGENNVFRAGTISTVANKTAYGYVRKFFEENYRLEDQPRRVEVERLANLAEGVKRTTGQHPGGIIILPQEYEIEDFTPVNYPADDLGSSWKTTHFDFHSIHDNLLKMDILGHVDPTALKMLRDLTGVDPVTISTSDPKVYALFSGLSSLGLTAAQINNETTGAIGIPEFGTQFVRGMLKETKPKTFADLVQISGLSHGTDVWLGNAQNLIRNGLANISSVIGCRDDIMVYLMSMGLEPSVAFVIMEAVRKGQGLKPNWIEQLRSHNVPDWYIDSCQKIKYMFPKAHATAYVLMAYRIAWYKIYYPEEYYATFFSTRANAFELKTALLGYDATLQRLRELEDKASKKETNAKENDLIVTFEVVLEMMARGIKIKNIDFNRSLSNKFLVIADEKTGEKVLYPPFNVIDSLGEAAADSIVDARKIKQFSSVIDLKTRTQITQTQLKIFEDLNITDSLSNDEQLTFEF